MLSEAVTRASSWSASSSVLIPARIAPRSRRWRVSARVSMPLMPTMPWAASWSSRLPVERQLEVRRAGSRTTKPAGHMRRLSSSSPFTPVLPMCGAVIATI
jgi:hypothetical protein